MKEQKRIVILGAGTAGTLMANKLAKKARKNNWQISVVDQHDRHYYQPGFLFYPFGRYKESDIVHSRRKYMPKRVTYIQQPIATVEAEKNKVNLANGEKLDYDLLIIATGSQIAPEETTGLKGEQWHKSIFDFYTFEGSSKLREKLKEFKKGTLVVNIVEMPIKCPVAPLEFSFLADDYFKKCGLREQINIKYVTPLSGAFTKPKAASSLGYLLKEKNIEIIADFGVEHVDDQAKKLVSYDEKEVKYDLLVTIPTNKGDSLMERSGLGDELNFVPTDHHTLQSKAHENIFVIGDATDVPASKAGSVAHFQADTLMENIRRYFEGRPLEASFDGHANCFVESGAGKGLLLDFNYEVEPLEGKFPFPLIGPLKLLRESRLNHFGKLAFRWIYWHLLMRGWPMPGIPSNMSMSGKQK